MQIQTWYKHKLGLGGGLALWEDKLPRRFTVEIPGLYYLLGILNKLEVTEDKWLPSSLAILNLGPSLCSASWLDCWLCPCAGEGGACCWSWDLGFSQWKWRGGGHTTRMGPLTLLREWGPRPATGALSHVFQVHFLNRFYCSLEADPSQPLLPTKRGEGGTKGLLPPTSLSSCLGPCRAPAPPRVEHSIIPKLHQRILTK